MRRYCVSTVCVECRQSLKYSLIKKPIKYKKKYKAIQLYTQYNIRV